MSKNRCRIYEWERKREERKRKEAIQFKVLFSDDYSLI